mmetsp:Transcript_21876/g.45541  ORF Transcript_21876/g.45541 Transcript_21876/m.45541 type:complete len:547 (-) Transcript_21876:113-1753(-)
MNFHRRHLLLCTLPAATSNALLTLPPTQIVQSLRKHSIAILTGQAASQVHLTFSHPPQEIIIRAHINCLLHLADSDDTKAIENLISEEDLDSFVEDLFAEVSELAATPTQSDMNATVNETIVPGVDVVSSKQTDVNSPFFIQRQQAVGIGGNAGIVYDVNALKRNLVQESVRRSKLELLALLSDGREDDIAEIDAKYEGKLNVVVPPRWRRDRDDLIEERLSSLVQSNPVSTTTDSNLLDGDWSFAFATNSASSILDTSRFLLSKTKRMHPEELQNENTGKKLSASSVRGGPWRFRTGKTENPFRSSSRQIRLEDLAEDENAHIVDKTCVFGGLFQISRRYDVFGLTRTALDLDLVKSETRLLGLPVRKREVEDFKGTKFGAPLELQIIYLDTDLCICTTGLGLDGPLHVYTKSDLWVTGGAKRKLRLLARTAAWISTIQSPLRIRQRLRYAFARNDDAITLTESELRALNIGELDINDDGTTKEDPAWDGEDDPFYHLAPAERMEVLKKMSLQDIYGAALKRKMQSKKEKKRWISRSKKFKRPDP